MARKQLLFNDDYTSYQIEVTDVHFSNKIEITQKVTSLKKQNPGGDDTLVTPEQIAALITAFYANKCGTVSKDADGNPVVSEAREQFLNKVDEDLEMAREEVKEALDKKQYMARQMLPEKEWGLNEETKVLEYEATKLVCGLFPQIQWNNFVWDDVRYIRRTEEVCHATYYNGQCKLPTGWEVNEKLQPQDKDWVRYIDQDLFEEVAQKVFDALDLDIESYEEVNNAGKLEEHMRLVVSYNGDKLVLVAFKPRATLNENFNNRANDTSWFKKLKNKGTGASKKAANKLQVAARKAAGTEDKES